MRLLKIAVLLTAFAGCAGQKEAATPGPLSGFPSPAELAAHSPKVTSGTLAPLNRTLVHPGEAYEPWPGFSANAELGSMGDAVLHGSTSALSFVIYQLSSNHVTHETLIGAVGMDVRWDGAEPSAPAGVYLGLPDHAADVWRWVDAREMTGRWYNPSSLNLRGLDPVNGVASYIAVVNFSSQDAHIDQLRLRYERPTTDFGDEYIYYTSHAEADPATATSISRASLASGLPELLFETDVATTTYIAPVIADYNDTWRLLYTRRVTGELGKVLLADVNGGGSVVFAEDPLAEYFPGGWNYGDNHALLIRYNGAISELWATDLNPATVDNGRLSRGTDNVGKAVWDLAIDTAFVEFAAIAALQVDALSDQYALVTFSGNRPFPIDATPTTLYTALPLEDARDPEMVELSDFFGNPEYWVYFAARNRDDASYNLYRVNRITGADPEPVYVDATYDLRFPAATTNGRYLTFIRKPAGSGNLDTGELVVADLLNPYGAAPLGPADAVGFASWYDPTP